MAELVKKIFRGALLLFAVFCLAHCAMGGTEVGNPRPGAGGETAGDGEAPAAGEVSPSPTPEEDLLIDGETETAPEEDDTTT